MSTRKRWCKYGDWDEIAQLRNQNEIKTKITGIPNHWKPNDLPIEARNLIPPESVIVDFGCGLGRNSELLRNLSPRVVGYDIPEMIRQLKQHSNIQNYTRTTSNLQDALAGCNVFYESVVIQHIVDFDEIIEIARQILYSSIQWVFLLNNVNNTMQPSTDRFVSLLDWDVVLTYTDTTSFLGMPHILRCLRRPPSHTLS